MFARLSAAILLALPLLAIADCTSSTAAQQCCQNVQDANTPGVATLLSFLGVVGDVTGQVGLTCDPITGIGAGGSSCNAQAVCCEDNSFNGVVALGCTPINVDA